MPDPFKEAGEQMSEQDETKSTSKPQAAKTEPISPSLITYHDSDDLCLPIVLPATQDNTGFVLWRLLGQEDVPFKQHVIRICPMMAAMIMK